jgi:hypothetical protein
MIPLTIPAMIHPLMAINKMINAEIFLCCQYKTAVLQCFQGKRRASGGLFRKPDALFGGLGPPFKNPLTRDEVFL